MSIFKRSSGDAQQTGTAPSPANTAPGVVPPPAAPMYSMRPAESVAERVRMARDAQMRARASVQAGIRGATQRPATATACVVTSRSHGAPATPRTMPPLDPSNPAACAQAGLLSLAWRWQDAGAPIRAIHAYVELLTRYPDTPAAAAAVTDLVELSEKLVEEGQFHTALAIYDHLEQLA